MPRTGRRVMVPGILGGTASAMGCGATGTGTGPTGTGTGGTAASVVQVPAALLQLLPVFALLFMAAKIKMSIATR